METLRSMVAAAVFCAVFVVYLSTIGDLPPPMVPSGYNIGQLTP